MAPNACSGRARLFRPLVERDSALPSQKALMFDLASIKGSIAEGHTKLRWTATENMLADALTKHKSSMEHTALDSFLETGLFSVQ